MSCPSGVWVCLCELGLDIDGSSLERQTTMGLCYGVSCLRNCVGTLLHLWMCKRAEKRGSGGACEGSPGPLFLCGIQNSVSHTTIVPFLRRQSCLFYFFIFFSGRCVPSYELRGCLCARWPLAFSRTVCVCTLHTGRCCTHTPPLFFLLLLQEEGDVQWAEAETSRNRRTRTHVSRTENVQRNETKRNETKSNALTLIFVPFPRVPTLFRTHHHTDLCFLPPRCSIICCSGKRRSPFLGEGVLHPRWVMIHRI